MNSKSVYFAICFIVLIISLAGCAEDETLVDVSDIPTDGIILKNWYLFGPFQSEGQQDYLNYDNLRFYNCDESSVTMKQLKKISNQQSTNQKKVLFGLFKSNNHIVDFNKAFGIDPERSISGNVYAACEMYSDKEKKIRLDFTSDDGAKIWFNHKLILNVDKTLPVYDYENYIELDIKKGYNFLLIKVYNGLINWQMIAKLLNDTHDGLKRYKNTSNRVLSNNFLVKSIIDTGTYLSVVKKICNNKKYAVIYNDKLQICFNDSMKEKVNINSLHNGLHTINLNVNDEVLKQYFYKGNIVEAINTIVLKLSQIQNSDKVRNCIETYIYRFKHLLKPENAPKTSSDQQLWQIKIINIYYNLNNILERLVAKEEPLKNLSGFHIGTFISNIDKQVQYYILNVPHNYNKANKYPLMIFMPVIEGTHRPYLECYRLANQPEINNLQRIADKYNICVVLPFCREVAKHNYNSILETDFFETLKSVKENFNIDTTRLYLTGTCSAGYKVLELATRHPNFFAAIGLVSPMFKNSMNNDFLMGNEPINYIKNISNIPTYIIHSSIDVHNPVISSDEFVEKANSLNMSNIKYYRSDKILDLYYWVTFSDSIVSFITKYKLNSSPENISFSTNQLKYNKAYWFKINDKPNSIAKVEVKANSDNTINIISQDVNSFELDLENVPYDKRLPLKIYENSKLIFEGKPNGKVLKFGKGQTGLGKTPIVEGPLSDALIHSFIIVKGTLGKTIEKQKISDLADSINAIWKARYFNDCQVKKDSEITESDMKNSNLVLLGNDNTNLLIKEIIKSLPVAFAEKSLLVRKKNYVGKGLGCYLSYPNPLSNKKYVVIIGSNDITSISLGPDDMNNIANQFDISAYGFYDYRIWDNQTNEILDRGYFSPQWK